MLSVPAQSTNGRWTLDLSGSQWQFEGIRPGQGEVEGFHRHAASVAGSTFNWNGASVPGDVYTGRLWIVNDLPHGHAHSTLRVTFSKAGGEVVSQHAHPIHSVAPDSSTPVAAADWKVAGRLGETFRVTLSLEMADGRVVSTNYYDLLIGDQDRARRECADLSARFRAVEERFHPADYYRFYPELGGTNRLDRMGDRPPAANPSSSPFQQPLGHQR